MVSANFNKSLSLVLRHEGGYVNNPNDPGGATNKGITQYTYDAYRGANNLPTRSVKSITDSELKEIYNRRYWDAIAGDYLPEGVDYAVFDFAVNSGPSRAVKFLQNVVGVDQDGAVGKITLGAVSRYKPTTIIERLCDKRLAWLKTLKTWVHFGNGWSRRVKEVKADAIGMVGTTQPLPDPNPTPNPIPEPTDPPPIDNEKTSGLFAFMLKLLITVVIAGLAVWLLTTIHH